MLLLTPKCHSSDEVNLPGKNVRIRNPNTTRGFHTDVTIQTQSAGYWS
jgi:hypothetical protein